MTNNQGVYNNEILDPGQLEDTGLKTPNDGTGLITINSGDSGKVDISATVGIFTNATTGRVKEVIFPGVTAHTPLNFGVGSGTFYYFDDTGALIERGVIEVGDFIERHAMFGITADDGTSIVLLSNYSFITRHSGSILLHEIMNSLRFVRRSGLIVGANGSNLVMNQTEGVAVLVSINNRDPATGLTNPHIKSFDAITGTSNLLFELWRSDGTNGETLQIANTAIQAGVYDDGTAISSDTSPQGTLQPNKWTAHHIFFVADFGILGIQYGQTVSDNAVDAVANIISQSFETLPSFTSTLPIAVLLVRGATTDLSLVTDAIFRPTDNVGNFR